VRATRILDACLVAGLVYDAAVDIGQVAGLVVLTNQPIPACAPGAPPFSRVLVAGLVCDAAADLDTPVGACAGRPAVIRLTDGWTSMSPLITTRGQCQSEPPRRRR